MDSYKLLNTSLAALFAVAVLLALGLFAPAAADEGPGDCFGVNFDLQNPIAIGKIAADEPRVYFLKNAADDPPVPRAPPRVSKKLI
jgi:hypothetical protein